MSLTLFGSVAVLLMTLSSESDTSLPAGRLFSPLSSAFTVTPKSPGSGRACTASRMQSRLAPINFVLKSGATVALNFSINDSASFPTTSSKRLDSGAAMPCTKVAVGASAGPTTRYDASVRPTFPSRWPTVTIAALRPTKRVMVATVHILALGA